MDQQNFYYGKPNIGSMNYQPVFVNSGSEYQAPAYNDQAHHSTGLNFNSGTSGTSSTCSDLSSTSATNLSRSANNNLIPNQSVEYNAVPYNRLYPYITDNTVQNVSSAQPNTSECSDISYGSAFNCKPYENTTNSVHVPVIAVTSNSSHTASYHSNSNYESYQNVDYSMHKALNQGYSSGTASTNRPTLNPATAFTSNLSMDHIAQQPSKSRTNISAEARTSAKTSVIKPLNPYNMNATGSTATPINYTKFLPYSLYVNNNKTVPTLDKSSSSNRGLYSSAHKSSDVYYADPISARYSNHGYALNVSNPNSGHANSHYLPTNSYPLNYGHHHLAQHQGNVSHPRNLLSTPTYQLDETVSANYLANRPNGLVVRPTPNTYKQSQIPYQNTYNYGRSNIPSGTSGSHVTTSHSTLSKSQSQKLADDSYSTATNEIDCTYDRPNYRQYGAMYSTNYIDPSSYDEYSQYGGFSSASSTQNPYYSTKHASQLLYNYGSSRYNSTAPHVQLGPQTSQSSPSNLPTTSTTTIVQQPVPINPNSSHLISSNYDTTSLHTHPILPPPLFNNNNKDYPSNQYQQNPYASQILYSTLQNGGYYKSSQPASSASVSDAHNISDKLNTQKSMPPPLAKYTIDLEEQINSSKIPKMHGSVILNSKSTQRDSGIETRVPVINVQESQKQRKVASSQSVNESNKSVYLCNDTTYKSCYQSQQWANLTTSVRQTSTSSTPHMHPKKQSIRDFLSTWIEDEEDESDPLNKKSNNNYNHNQFRNQSSSQSHIVTNNVQVVKTAKINENVPVIMPPIVQPTPIMQAPNHLPQSFAPSNYSNMPIQTVPIIPPKIHVGITVENGNQNLPDIIIDIEKTKVNGEGECFERANVIQEVPKSSEKLYILDSIDVPVGELSKYRHLSVVNKIPDDIIFRPPPPLRHDVAVPTINEPMKIVDQNIDEYQSDFEVSADRDDYIETKNTSIMPNVLKLFQKYQNVRKLNKQREQLHAKPKYGSSTQQLHVPNEHNNDLSTPLGSLSPAHDFDVEMASAVDLSMNSKGIFDEFIDDFPICDDSGSGYDLIGTQFPEILQFTEQNDDLLTNDKHTGDDDTQKKEIDNQITNDQENVEQITDKKEEKEHDVEYEKEMPIEKIDKIEEQSESCTETLIDTLQSYCIKTFNTENFRNYFTETVINTKCDEGEQMLDELTVTERSVGNDIDDKHNDTVIINNRNDHGNSVNSHETVSKQEQSIEICTKAESSTSITPVPTLRKLATDMIRLNHFQMMKNLNSLKNAFDVEPERKSCDSYCSVNKVRTLQELAREVAITIYSFNAKPLKALCQLAMDKYNNIYLASRLETSTLNMPSHAALENFNDTNIATMVEKIQPRFEEQTVIQRVNANGIQMSLRECENMDESEMFENPVKLKILAQICVDELKKTKANTDSIYISSDSDSDSDSDISSVRSSPRRGSITGGKSSSSESETSSDSDTTTDSSSESDDDDDFDSIKYGNKSVHKMNCDDQIVKKENESGDECENAITVNQIETSPSEPSFANKVCDESTMDLDTNTSSMCTHDVVDVNELFNPRSLKDICEKVLNDNSMIVQYDVPTLKYLCELTMAGAGMEIPCIYFVHEADSYEYMSSEQPSEDEKVILCIDSEFDETELANLFNGAGNATESVEIESVDNTETDGSKTSLIDQCVALQNILSSPPPEDNRKIVPEIESNDTAIYLDTNVFSIGDEFHDSIQYEETVLPTESDADSNSISIGALKKQLQQKYVHPSCYHKMFVINKLLRKYKVHQVSVINKKIIVQRRLRKVIFKLRQKAKKQRKPKKIATRRSARIADKIKQQRCDQLDRQSTNIKPTKMCKTMKSDSMTLDKKPMTDTDEESIKRDILKLIAQKRTLKRKLSICHRPTLNLDTDGYCYDEDGQISDMLRSFIDNDIDDNRKDSVKRPRSRKSSIDTSIKDTKKKKSNAKSGPVKKSVKKGDKNKSKKSLTKCSKTETKPTTKNPTIKRRLTMIESHDANKTEIKNQFRENIQLLRTKASVKDIIPAKRTRFLSIDSSLTRYGSAPKKTFGQMKPYADDPGTIEINKRIAALPKIMKKTVNSNQGSEVKHAKGKNISELPQPTKPDQSSTEVINLQRTQTISEKNQTPQKDLSNKFIGENKNITKSIMKLPPMQSLESAKSTQQLKFKSTDELIDDVKACVGLKTFKSVHSTDRAEKMNLSNAKHEQEPLMDRSLCSKLLSPMKILIEPTHMKYPCEQSSVTNNLITSSKKNLNESSAIVSSSLNYGKRDKRRKTRFSDIIPSPTPAPIKPIEHVENRRNVRRMSFKEFMLEKNKKDTEKLNMINSNGQHSKNENETQTAIQVTTPKPAMQLPKQQYHIKTDVNVPVTLYVDIEQFLPSTRILQPKAAKRCLSRAQTISIADMRHTSYEPISTRPNYYRNYRNVEAANHSIPPSVSSRLMDTFSIPKRSNQLTPYSPTRANLSPNVAQVQSNSSPQIQKISTITYPDPESLQIPSIDLRSLSSSCSQSPLPDPINKAIPTPIRTTPIESNNLTTAVKNVSNRPASEEKMSQTCNKFDSFNLSAESHSNEPITIQSSALKLPPVTLEMNTIPLELDRVVTQQRQIREMRRRNSLCVAEISNYQRNILNKFANSIKHKKLKVEDILKSIRNKRHSSSGSSIGSDSDSSDSDSSESDSSSSSSSSSQRKSKRHRKKKRSHKRNSNDSSSESSSSSSSSSSSPKRGTKRSKLQRKSTQKSVKNTNGRKKNTPKPIFDIETIKQNALMNLHEEMMRKKFNHNPYNTMDNSSPTFAQSQNTMAMKLSNDPKLAAKKQFY